MILSWRELMIKYFVKLGQAPDFYWSDDEWKDFVKTLKKLPYIEDIRGGI
jgi:hypothetical protein